MVNNEQRLMVDIAGIKMKNPVIAASGCYGYGQDYLDFISPEKWGAITVKGTTLKPRQGNPPPRLAETPSGLINSVGLQNPGIDYVLQEELTGLADYDVPVIINISGETIEEYVLLAEKLSGIKKVGGIELNISCPNVKKGGLAFGSDPAVVKELVAEVRARYSGTLIVKLTPNTGELPDIAAAAEEAGADALSLINTLRAMEIDIEKEKPVLSTGIGGLSGPAIRPVAVRAVWEVAGEVKIPVIGMGGITCAGDALQFILAGASAVSIGTANFINPLVLTETLEGLEQYMKQKGYSSIEEICGAARR